MKLLWSTARPKASPEPSNGEALASVVAVRLAELDVKTESVRAVDSITSASTASPDDHREWDPRLLALRAGLEDRFLGALRADAPVDTSDIAAQALDGLQLEPIGEVDGSVSPFLRAHGSLDHFREYAALRSLYHLKEADPHAWVIPRLRGRAKAAMVAMEFDEFGAGRAEEIHARLFADLMADLGLDTSYGHYVDAAPAEALATVNMKSLFRPHRALRGALVGHFATVEITSSPASRRLAARLLAARCDDRSPLRTGHTTHTARGTQNA